MTDASAQFSSYLEAHAMAPYNDAFIDYLNIFIRAEETKLTSGGSPNKMLEDSKLTSRVSPNKMLEDLKQLAEEHNQKKERFLRRQGTSRSDMTASAIFDLIYELYELPINGKFILEQMQILQDAQRIFTKVEENKIVLPNVRYESTVMRELKRIFGERVQLVNRVNEPEYTMF